MLILWIRDRFLAFIDVLFIQNFASIASVVGCWMLMPRLFLFIFVFTFVYSPYAYRLPIDYLLLYIYILYRLVLSYMPLIFEVAVMAVRIDRIRAFQHFRWSCRMTVAQCGAVIYSDPETICYDFFISLSLSPLSLHASLPNYPHPWFRFCFFEHFCIDFSDFRMSNSHFSFQINPIAEPESNGKKMRKSSFKGGKLVSTCDHFWCVHCTLQVHRGAKIELNLIWRFDGSLRFFSKSTLKFVGFACTTLYLVNSSRYWTILLHISSKIPCCIDSFSHFRTKLCIFCQNLNLV